MEEKSLNIGEFEDQWKKCQNCVYGEKAHKHILFDLIPNDVITISVSDSYFPVDLMIIGEGPGAAEDMVGKPFIGKSGKILRRILNDIQIEDRTQGEKQIIITNLVACRPIDGETPQLNCLDACFPRLQWLINYFKPKKIVALGETPGEYLKMKGIHHERTHHPAHLCYLKQEESGYKYDQFVNCLKRNLKG